MAKRPLPLHTHSFMTHSFSIKLKGLPILICMKLFWAMKVPIVRSELWLLLGDRIDALRTFHGYVGRRSQPFPSYSLT